MVSATHRSRVQTFSRVLGTACALSHVMGSGASIEAMSPRSLYRAARREASERAKGGGAEEGALAPPRRKVRDVAVREERERVDEPRQHRADEGAAERRLLRFERRARLRFELLEAPQRRAHVALRGGGRG